jgi:LmbE family N-acetylglucosaminyl deacetylase
MKVTRAELQTRLDALVTDARAAQAVEARRAEALIAAIARKRPRIATTFYDVAQHLDALRRANLHRALGYASFDAMLRARGLFSPTQARKLVAVARALPREVAQALGSERASAVVAYAAAVGGDAAQLLAAGHRVGAVALADATPRALREAARGARTPSPDTRAAQRTVDARLRRVTRWLHAQGLRGATVSHARGAVVVTLPLDAADAL